MRRCCGWWGWSVRKFEPSARLNIRRTNMVKGERMYSKQNWKWMLARLWKDENIGSYVGYSRKSNQGFCSGSLTSSPPCHPLLLCWKLLLLYGYTGWKCRKVWAPKLVIKMEMKNRQKQDGSGAGVTMKMTWNMGSVNDEKRSCGENFMAAAQCNGCEEGRVDGYTRKRLRSSSSLRVVPFKL